MGDAFPLGAMGIDVRTGLEHNTLRVSDSAIGFTAALAPGAALGQRRNAWLEQLIRRDAEEIGDPINVAQRKFSARFSEDFTDPAFAFVTVLCQVLPCFPACAQERIDVLFD